MSIYKTALYYQIIINKAQIANVGLFSEMGAETLN